MRNLCNPKWLLLVNTLPLALLLTYFTSKYHIIYSLLSDENIRWWKYFGLALAIMAVVHLAYTLYLVRTKRQLPIRYTLVTLVAYIIYLYSYGYNLDQFLTSSMPRWLIPVDIELYLGTFIMPTLVHALFVLVVRTTSSTTTAGVWKNFSVIVIVPVTWFLFIQIVMPLWRTASDDFANHAIVILTIASTLVFLFYVVRGVYVLAINQSSNARTYQLLWKIPFSILFPVLGLLLNNGDFASSLVPGDAIFGDFSHPAFYVLAIINGVLVCMPQLDHRTYRLALFTGRCISFSYTFYFFLVFLPYLPLSVIAVTAIGVGFLMLTPLVLFAIHITVLTEDIKYLSSAYSNTRLYLTFIAGLLVIPVVITLNYQQHRLNLNTALDYLYNPDYSTEYHINPDVLQQTLAAIKSMRRTGGPFTASRYTPYLSSYFNWLVLDNLVLSRSKQSMIDRVFFGQAGQIGLPDNQPPSNVHLTQLDVHSRYDQAQGAWISQLDMQLTNESDISLSEYVKRFRLPEGAWISDYYLYVNGQKKQGLLSEKKSAMWIYSAIVNRSKDPGILYYLTGNNVALRVFPFASGEVRYTGIEIIHKEPFELDLDGQTVKLGASSDNPHPTDIVQLDNVIYVPGSEKHSLDKVNRRPYLHFVVDTSTGQDSHYDQYIKRVQHFLERNAIDTDSSRISLVNTYTSTYTLNDLSTDTIHPTFEGGFYLDRAIRTILFDAYRNNDDRYPLIVVVTNDMAKAVIEHNFADFQFAFPESDLFYSLGDKQQLNSHSLLTDPHQGSPSNVDSLLLNRAVLAYPNKHKPIAYLRDNSEPEIVLNGTLSHIDDKHPGQNSWQSGLRMQAVWRSQVLHPHQAKYNWRELIRDSFSTGIMTPLTSYIVVETEAQKIALLEKQKKVLSGNRALDPGDDVMRMSEPGTLILLVFMALLLARTRLTPYRQLTNDAR